MFALFKSKVKVLEELLITHTIYQLRLFSLQSLFEDLKEFCYLIHFLTKKKEKKISFDFILS
jgi:hypothetical protein